MLICHLCRPSRKKEKQERRAAALQASSSRRRSQALMLSMPAVRCAAVTAHRTTEVAKGGCQTGASKESLPASTSPAWQSKIIKAADRGDRAAADAARPDKQELDPVRGTKRLCKRKDSDLAPALAQIASMPASLADSTQQEPASPLPELRTGDAAPPARPRAESPLPDWLCNNAPDKTSDQPAKASVSPLWIMDSEDARTLKAHTPEPAGQGAKKQPNLAPGWSKYLADPPSSLVGDSGERRERGVPVPAHPKQNGSRADADFGAWRSRGGFAQPPKLHAARRELPTSQHTYQDTFRCGSPSSTGRALC